MGNKHETNIWKLAARQAFGEAGGDELEPVLAQVELLARGDESEVVAWAEETVRRDDLQKLECLMQDGVLPTAWAIITELVGLEGTTEDGLGEMVCLEHRLRMVAESLEMARGHLQKVRSVTGVVAGDIGYVRAGIMATNGPIRYLVQEGGRKAGINLMVADDLEKLMPKNRQ